MGKVGTEATLQAILGKVNNIEAYTDILANGYSAHDWHGFQILVNDGVAEAEFPVGSQLLDTWNKTDNDQWQIPYDIVHYNTQGDAFLKWHYALPDGVPFDEPEAIYYFDGTEAAGDYYITIGSAYGTGWDTTKHIQITLTSAPAENDQLVISCGTDNKNDPTNGRAWNVYGAGSTTSKQSGTTSNGTSGTNLGTIGATSAQKPEGRLNAISRVVYGSGRWSQSAMRQYLNTDAAAGAWWTQQNPWDRPPSVATTLRGFMAGISDGLKDIIQKTTVVTALNTVEGYADTSEETEDYFFLPSLQEMYIAPQLADTEGEDWDYYKDLAAEAGLSGKFQQYGTYPILISYKLNDTTSPVTVWLRSCNRGYASYAWLVNSAGYVGYGSASSAVRGCPACKIQKSTAI